MSASRGESARERIAYAVYASAQRAAIALPESVGRRLFALAGSAAFHVAPRTRRVVEANLATVLGTDPGAPILREATREAFLSYARYWYDAFHVRALSDAEFMGRVRAEGREHLERAMVEGHGAVVALPHLGNWDAAGKWVYLSGWKITAVAELLRPERLFELFVQHRQALGLGIVPLHDTTSVGQELARLLAENEVIALVADRNLKGTGVEVEMFGATRRMPAGPALLALLAGVPLLPCAVYDTEEGWVIVINPPLEIERTDHLRSDVTALTRRLAREFERAIAAAPTQWHMFQPAWEDGATRAGPAEAGGSLDATPAAGSADA
ncbi:MAG TPA: phosphatidylinositol mannoside acyltransferase [Actinomycetota bacterium]|nr:phosphatidylinositol mannoside acyltransferase [Actinomycetota bacterium]